MLSLVKVTNSQGITLNLPLGDETAGLILQGIEGLDPVKATLVSSSFATVDGAQYHSSRREARNIKMNFGLAPDFVTTTVKSLRAQLYGYFMPKTQVTLRFQDSDGTYVDILGRIESLETLLFAQNPVVDISIMCFDPDFYDPNPVTVPGVSTAGATLTPVPYSGTVETGVLFTLTASRNVSDFTIYLTAPDGTVRTVQYTLPLVVGDVLKINSVVGAKSVILTRGGVDTSLLYGLSPTSSWLELQPGLNQIRVAAVGAGVAYSLIYTTKYGGL